VSDLGYGRDFADVPGWWCVRVDVPTRCVELPTGGASTSAPRTGVGVYLARVLGCGVVVTLGEDHTATDPARDPMVTCACGLVSPVRHDVPHGAAGRAARTTS
jgi:hypothetical protein